jgi:hypothetical protein
VIGSCRTAPPRPSASSTAAAIGNRYGNAGFAGAFDAERVGRRRYILEEGHLNGRDLGMVGIR